MKRLKLCLLGVILIVGLSKCRKGDYPVPDRDSVPSINEGKIKTLEAKLMTEMLIMAKESQFRVQVRDECIKQENGEYEVTFEKIIKLNESNPLLASSVGNLKSLVIELRSLKNAEPVIFYPRAEVYDDYRKNDGYLANRIAPEDQYVPAGTYIPPGIPTAAYQDYYYPDYSTDGFTINSNNYLSYFGNINEDYAWENDVWVVGYGEDCSSGNLVDAPPPLLNPERTQGQSERGMIIQCTSLNSIEHWTSGKLEFKYTVLNSSGATILGPITAGRVKRKYFRNQQWYDYNKFIGNWHTSTFGNWMYEHWIEEDGGSSDPISITLPPPPGSSGPTYTVSIPAKERDDDLGKVTVQFTDAITQIYNISYANVKRKN